MRPSKAMGIPDRSGHPVAIVGGRIDHAHCYVRDLQGAAELFTRVLGIQLTAPFDLEGMRPCTSRLGIEIAATTATGARGAENPLRTDPRTD